MAIFAFPALAWGAEELVPPGNSAVNQYTETFPTSGGDRDAGRRQGRRPKPAAVLGSRNARRLEAHGPKGKEVAHVVAATAPATTAAPAPAESSEEGGVATGGDGGNRGGGEGAASRQVDKAPRPAPGAVEERVVVVEADDSAGSSGFGEVLAQATGSSSSGGIGLLLPLAIVAAAGWALAFLWRTRGTAQ